MIAGTSERLRCGTRIGKDPCQTLRRVPTAEPEMIGRHNEHGRDTGHTSRSRVMKPGTGTEMIGEKGNRLQVQAIERPEPTDKRTVRKAIEDSQEMRRIVENTAYLEIGKMRVRSNA